MWVSLMPESFVIFMLMLDIYKLRQHWYPTVVRVLVITTAQLHSTKPELRFCAGCCVGDLQWWGSLTMFPAGNKGKCLSSANHTTKSTHHDHCEIKSCGEDDGIFYELHLSRGIPRLSYSFIPFQEVEKQERTNFFMSETWSINYK